MRIRKQCRKVSAVGLPGDYPGVSFLKGGDWDSQMSSESDKIDILFVKKSGSDDPENSRQHAVAVQEGHVEPGRDKAEVVKLDSQTRPLEEGNARGSRGIDDASVLRAQVQPPEKSKKLSGRGAGWKRSPKFCSPLSNLWSESEGVFVREHASSLPVDTLLAKVDQTKSTEVSEPGFSENTTPEDDNTTIHYGRRILREAGDDTFQAHFDDGFPEEDVLAVGHIPKPEIDEVKQSESGQSPSSGIKTGPPSSGGLICNSKHTRAVPCSSSEDHDHPSREPEGSLLHSLYLQLLAAGNEGITVKELFASFALQIMLPRLASNWREQVKAHLKSNSYFEEVKGRYFLCEQLVQPRSKRSGRLNANSGAFISFDLNVNPRTPSREVRFKTENSLSVPSRMLSDDTHEGMQTRRKAYEKTIEAVLNESVMEFHKMKKDKVINGDVGAVTCTESSASDFEHRITQIKSSRVRVSEKRKSSDGEDELLPRNIRYGGAIPGSLKAMQAKIIAETGVQNGVRCARKDGSNESSKWQCPMMAMEGHSLCEHHNFLSERKKARYAKAKKQGGSKVRPALQKEMKRDTIVSRKQLKGEADESPGAEAYKVGREDFVGLDEVATQALVNMKSETSVGHFQFETQRDGTLPVSQNVYSPEAEGKFMNEQPKRIAKKSVSQSFRSTTTGRFVAAKKTAVKSQSVAAEEKLQEKQSVPSIRPPAIPPLPMQYGMRRKIVKNRCLLSL